MAKGKYIDTVLISVYEVTDVGSAISTSQIVCLIDGFFVEIFFISFCFRVNITSANIRKKCIKREKYSFLCNYYFLYDIICLDNES